MSDRTKLVFVVCCLHATAVLTGAAALALPVVILVHPRPQAVWWAVVVACVVLSVLTLTAAIRFGVGGRGGVRGTDRP